MKKYKGITLVEIILAIVLMGIIVTGFLPSLSFSYRHLRQSQVFTQEVYDYQEKIEQLIEQKKREEPTDPLTTKTVSIFGKQIKGHLIRVNDSASSDMTVFVAKESIPNIVPVISTAPEIKVYNGGLLLSPSSPIDMTNASLTMTSIDPLITNETKSSFLMYVYRWYLSDEMESSIAAPTNTKEYTAIKEWNEAKAELTFAQSNNLSFIPNIKTDYNKLNISSLKTELSLSEEAWINQFGNRYVMYGVTPYSNSGRIGKELLSNKIYLEAPKLVIESAKFTSDKRVIEITFNSEIKTDILTDKLMMNSSLGVLTSAVRSNLDHKVMIVTFDRDLPTNTVVTDNQIQRGGVSHLTYGYISIWGSGQPEGRFTIQPHIPIVATKLTVAPISAVLDIDETIQLVSNMLPNGANDEIQWISSNESVATVADGLVTAIGFGTANITVKTLDGRLTANCAVTVIHVPEIVKAGYLKDDGHTGNKVNKIYVEFNGPITSVNLDNPNQNKKIDLKIGNKTYTAVNYEMCWQNPNAMILYFNEHNKASGQLSIIGERVKIQEAYSEFTQAISKDIIGDVTYRYHAKHTYGADTKFLKAFTEDQLGQYSWNAEDLSQRWILRNSSSSNQPINRFTLSSDTYYYLVNTEFSSYLEADNSNDTTQVSGQQVFLGSGTNNKNQRLRFVSIGSDGYYKIFTVTKIDKKNYYDRHVIDIHSGSIADASENGNAGKLIRYTENSGDSPNQLFRFEPVIEFND